MRVLSTGILRLLSDDLLKMEFIQAAQLLTKLPSSITCADLFSSIKEVSLTSCGKKWKDVLSLLMKEEMRWRHPCLHSQQHYYHFLCFGYIYLRCFKFQHLFSFLYRHFNNICPYAYIQLPMPFTNDPSMGRAVILIDVYCILHVYWNGEVYNSVCRQKNFFTQFIVHINNKYHSYIDFDRGLDGSIKNLI